MKKDERQMAEGDIHFPKETDKILKEIKIMLVIKKSKHPKARKTSLDQIPEK